MKKLIFFLILPLMLLAQNYNAGNLKDGQFMRGFLLIGPFPNALPAGITNYYHTDDCQGWNEDFLASAGGEKGVVPEAGKTLSYKGKNYSWINYSSDQDQVNLKKVFTPNDGVEAYAACWIESESAREKVFGFGSNDGAKVWLNGKLVHKIHMPRPVQTDDDYFRLALKKGKNLLLIKIDQGFGGWGFVIRPVDEKQAWNSIKERLGQEMVFEFKREGDNLTATVGDPLSLAAFKDLSEITLEFSAIHINHKTTIKAKAGSKIELPVKDFPDSEYAITAFIPIDAKTIRKTYGYMFTKGDMVKETKALIYKKLPELPYSPRAEYLKDFLNTLRWMDGANKMWGHSYGYRRYLDGLKNVFTEAEKLKTSQNPFDGLFLKPKKIIKKTGNLTLTNSWKIIDKGANNDFIKIELNRFWRKYFNEDANFSVLPAGKNEIILNLGDLPEIPPLTDAYYLEIKSDKVEIKGRSRRAIYYALSTLLDLLEQKITIPNAVVLDWPSAPYRSVLAGGTKITDGFRAQIDRFAAKRYNMVYIHSDNYLHLEDTAKKEALKEMFAYCRSRFIEPIPYIETFGAGTITRVLDPCLDEGIYHQKEAWPVPENGLITLNVPRIHDCENTTLHIFTEKDKELKRDVDYKLISAENPKIQILNKKFYNQKLLFSYDAVDFSRFSHPASCPSDPRGWEIQDRVIGNILKTFKPKYFHISQDEAGFINMDSRCLARGLTNKELMIDELNRVHRIIRKYDKDVEIHMWGDLFNDYQNAPKIGATGAVENIPRDIVVLDWNYAGVYHWHREKTYNQLKNYTQFGMKVMGVSWWEPINVMDIEMAGALTPRLYLGMMHTAWSGFHGGFMPTAEANWTGSTILGRIKF